MQLQDYRNEIDRIESGQTEGTCETLLVALSTLARELEDGLWQPQHRQEARELAGHARQLEQRVDRESSSEWSEYRSIIRPYQGHLQAQ